MTIIIEKEVILRIHPRKVHQRLSPQFYAPKKFIDHRGLCNKLYAYYFLGFESAYREKLGMVSEINNV
jgi:hypothetical protein